METKAMAGVAYLGRGIIKVTITDPPPKLVGAVKERGYKSPLQNSSFFKYLEADDWGFELRWMLQNLEHFDRSNMEVLKRDMDELLRRSDISAKEV